MLDLNALAEMHQQLKKFEKQRQFILGEAYTLGLRGLDKATTKNLSSSEAKDLVTLLPPQEDVVAARFVLEAALEEKATAQLLSQCLVAVLFPRTKYNSSLPKTAYLVDLLDLLAQTDPVSCIAVYRAILNAARSLSFTPPSSRLVDGIHAEEGSLIQQLSELARYEQILTQLTRIKR